MKTLAIGTRVRLAPRIWGTIKALTDSDALISWIKIKGCIERRYRMKFPIAEIVPDADPLAASVPWRLRYWVQDGRGSSNEGLLSEPGNKTAEWWSTYSPKP